MFKLLIQHLDWLAMAFILLGYARLASVKIDGWIWTCIGSILLTLFGTLIVPDALGVAIGNSFFIYTTIKGFLKWKKSPPSIQSSGTK